MNIEHIYKNMIRGLRTAFHDHLCRVDNFAAAENLGGIKRIFVYIGRLFKQGKGDEFSRNSKPVDV
jgi:hypothetical protein